MDANTIKDLTLMLIIARIDKFRQRICRFFFADFSFSASFSPTHDRQDAIVLSFVEN